MKKIAVFGAGGFGREVVMLIEQINDQKKQWDIIGFYDDGEEKGKIINDYPVLGGIEEINQIADPIYLVLAIGDPSTKKKIHNSIKNTAISYPTLIHPNVQMGKKQFIKIGEGCIITAGNILTVNIELEKHVILNLCCTVGHDTLLKDYSSFMPSVNISGEVLIGECVFVGTGAKIINQLEIGNNTFVGAGSVVTKDLPSNCTAVGIPAKPIKFHT